MKHEEIDVMIVLLCIACIGALLVGVPEFIWTSPQR